MGMHIRVPSFNTSLLGRLVPSNLGCNHKALPGFCPSLLLFTLVHALLMPLVPSKSPGVVDPFSCMIDYTGNLGFKCCKCFSCLNIR
jgi:hypothetical protein